MICSIELEDFFNSKVALNVAEEFRRFDTLESFDERRGILRDFFDDDIWFDFEDFAKLTCADVFFYLSGGDQVALQQQGDLSR